MIHLKQAVIVEGKYDKIRLSSVVDALIITTEGFRIFKDKEKMELIRSLAVKNGIVILTDSDSAGFAIRSHIKGCINGGKITNIYIPDIFGKEKRKTVPSKEGKLGVEGIDCDILAEAFRRSGVIAGDYVRTESVSRETLFDDGFIGTESAVERRRLLSNALGLPRRLSTNSLLEVLNSAFTYEEYRAAVEKIN